ncbi:hypothetical protein [Neobacillus mesonae]|nr:hypothetical protein [Neobacillus mesonae]MCM3571085.1 hypothetical protein [Neobacillus mesonae]
MTPIQNQLKSIGFQFDIDEDGKYLFCNIDHNRYSPKQDGIDTSMLYP